MPARLSVPPLTFTGAAGDDVVDAEGQRAVVNGGHTAIAVPAIEGRRASADFRQRDSGSGDGAVDGGVARPAHEERRGGGAGDGAAESRRAGGGVEFASAGIDGQPAAKGTPPPQASVPLLVASPRTMALLAVPSWLRA